MTTVLTSSNLHRTHGHEPICTTRWGTDRSSMTTKRVFPRRASPPPARRASPARSAHSHPPCRPDLGAKPARPDRSTPHHVAHGGKVSPPHCDATRQKCDELLGFFAAVLERKHLRMSPELSEQTRRVLLRLSAATATSRLTEQGAMAYAEYMGLVAECLGSQPLKASEAGSAGDEWRYTVGNRKNALRSTAFESPLGVSADLLMFLVLLDACKHVCEASRDVRTRNAYD